MAWYNDLGRYIKKGVTWVTDTLGLTDSEAPERAADAAQEGMSSANQQLYRDMQPGLQSLWQGVMGRGLGQNLDRFDTSMHGAMDTTQQTADNAQQEMNAGSAGNVQNYMNPKMDEILRGTSQAMQGGAGAALQSSATNRNIADAVGRQAGQMWDTAFGQALGDSTHNLQANQQIGQSANQQAGIAQSQISADNDPIMNWINLNNDFAMQKYAGNTGITQANVQAQGQSRAIL